MLSYTCGGDFFIVNMKIKKVIFIITACLFTNINLHNAFSNNNNENLVQLKIPLYSSEPFQIDKNYCDRYSVLQQFTSNKQNPFINIHNLDFYGDITVQLLDSAGKLNEDVFINRIYKNDEYTASSIKQMLFSILRNVQFAMQNLLIEDQHKNLENYNEIQTFYNLLLGDVSNIIFTSDCVRYNAKK